MVGGGDQSKADRRAARGCPRAAAQGDLPAARVRAGAVGDRLSENTRWQPHDWRAVSTIKLGEKSATYPSYCVVQVRTRDFCSSSVGATSATRSTTTSRARGSSRGRVAGRQPALRVLGADGRMRRAAVVASLAAGLVLASALTGGGCSSGDDGGAASAPNSSARAAGPSRSLSQQPQRSPADRHAGPEAGRPALLPPRPSSPGRGPHQRRPGGALYTAHRDDLRRGHSEDGRRRPPARRRLPTRAGAAGAGLPAAWLASFLGGTVDDLRLSMLRAVWFTPTVEESDAGADGSAAT